MIELLKSNLEYVYALIAQIPLVFIKPKQYVDLIEKESGSETVKRIIFISLICTIIFLSITLLFSHHESSISKLLPISLLLLEVGSSVFVILSLIITRYFFERKASIKTLLVYIFTLQQTLGIIYFILTMLFWYTESYRFAIIRGIATYLGLIYILVSPSILFSFTRNKRILAVISTIVSYILICTFIGIILQPNSNNGTPIKPEFSPFYDPIGSEELNYIKIHYCPNV